MDHFSSDLRNTNFYSGATSKNDVGVLNSALFDKSKGVQTSILNLKPGDSFNGEISNINGEEVTLKLLNGEALQARIEGNILLRVGQLLTFQVQSNEQNKIVLKPVLNNQLQVGEYALKQAALPVNDKTRSLVTSMLDSGMSVDKSNLQSMYRASLNFPDTNIETLSMLQKLDIPLTKNNILQYEYYKNFEYRLLDSMEDIISDIDTVMDSLPKEEINSFIDKILKVFDKTNEASAENTDSLIKLNDQTGLIDKENNIEAVKIENVNTDVLNNKAVNNDSNNIDYKANEFIATEIKSSDLGNIEKNISDSGNEDNNITASKDFDIKENYIPSSLDNANNENKLNTKNSVNDNNELNINSEKIVNVEKDKATNTFDSDKKDFTGDNKEAYINNNQIIDTKVLKQELKERLREEIQKNWMLEPKEVEEKEKIQKLYKRVERETKDLEAILEHANKNPEFTPKSAGNIQKNMQFMQQLDNMFSYVQLPLKFSEGKAHGDLYVMTNKKNLAKKDGTLTAFLHLDMTNLGSTDIKLTLQTDRNSLRVDFYLQEDSIKIISEHIDELNKALEAKGYSIKTTISPYEEEKPIIDRMEESVGLGNSRISYQAFDIRA